MSAIQTVEELAAAAAAGGEPPEGLSGPLRALFYTKADRWHEAHEVAQDLGTPLGDRIHGLLHLIEGDLGNASYWYQRVGAARPEVSGIEEEWRAIAERALQGAEK